MPSEVPDHIPEGSEATSEHLVDLHEAIQEDMDKTITSITNLLTSETVTSLSSRPQRNPYYCFRGGEKMPTNILHDIAYAVAHIIRSRTQSPIPGNDVSFDIPIADLVEHTERLSAYKVGSVLDKIGKLIAARIQNTSYQSHSVAYGFAGTGNAKKLRIVLTKEVR